MKRKIPCEQELLQLLKQNDQESFRELYMMYSKKLYSFARSFRLCSEDAEEIVQETFIRIWTNRHKIKPEASFNAYLITIARNLIYNHLKKETYRIRYINDMLIANRNDIHTNEREFKHIVESGIAQLPTKCGRVFRMSRLEGYSNQQIAEELAISKSTVENHLNKALKYIRKFMKSYGYRHMMMWIF